MSRLTNYIDDPTKTVRENINAAVAERRRLFEAAHPVPRVAHERVPDIPAERYDTCACGLARFFHDGRAISWLGFECAGPFVLADRLLPLTDGDGAA